MAVGALSARRLRACCPGRSGIRSRGSQRNSMAMPVGGGRHPSVPQRPDASGARQRTRRHGRCARHAREPPARRSRCAGRATGPRRERRRTGGCLRPRPRGPPCHESSPTTTASGTRSRRATKGWPGARAATHRSVRSALPTTPDDHDDEFDGIDVPVAAEVCPRTRRCWVLSRGVLSRQIKHHLVVRLARIGTRSRPQVDALWSRRLFRRRRRSPRQVTRPTDPRIGSTPRLRSYIRTRRRARWRTRCRTGRLRTSRCRPLRARPVRRRN